MKYLVLFTLLLFGISTASAGDGKTTPVENDSYSEQNQTCIDGVLYIIFLGHITVKYNTDSTVALCDPKGDK